MEYTKKIEEFSRITEVIAKICTSDMNQSPKDLEESLMKYLKDIDSEILEAIHFYNAGCAVVCNVMERYIDPKDFN